MVSAADKQKLMKLAGDASSIKGYVISVLGYADPRGDAAANERLSDRRAQTGHELLEAEWQGAARPSARCLSNGRDEHSFENRTRPPCRVPGK